MFCNNCGYSNASDALHCTSCGAAITPEPHISDITSGDVLFCDICGSTNMQEARYCRVCGRNLSSPQIPPALKQYRAAYAVPEQDNNDIMSAALLASRHAPELSASESDDKTLIEKLDKMERDLELLKNEPLPETPQAAPDTLDAHEETLKNISYKLDTIIADLLKAEAKEYNTFHESQRIDADGASLKAKNAQAGQKNSAGPPKKKGKSFLEKALIIALAIACFLVGMTFGLWGMYFLGL